MTTCESCGASVPTMTLFKPDEDYDCGYVEVGSCCRERFEAVGYRPEKSA